MREQLIKYVELLFAGAPNSNEVKQEILQNTLDRFDDLISQGKSPEAAYRLAISGIGDISEILDGASTQEEVPQTDVSTEPVIQYTAPPSNCIPRQERLFCIESFDHQYCCSFGTIDPGW